MNYSYNHLPFLLLILCLCNLAPSRAQTTPPADTFSPGDVLINEVMADPKGAKGLPATQYVELYNASSREISLKGWTFIYDDVEIAFPEAPFKAGRYAVLYRKGNDLPLKDDVLKFGLRKFPDNMADANKTLRLKDPSETVIHTYTYPKAKAGRSIERGESDGAWHLSSDPRGGTPGEANSDGAPDEPETPEKFSPGDVLINEVMADPKGAKGLPATQYVELYNASGREISLKGWIFIYDEVEIAFPEAPFKAGRYAVLFRKGNNLPLKDDVLKFGLRKFPDNMADANKTLSLKDPSGTVIHTYTYPKAKAGRSIERGKSDDAWHLSSDPRGGTPGETNSDGAPDEPDEPETPEKFSPGDVLINEVMAYPKGAKGLPATQYVELYNASGREISLKGWTFIYDDMEIAFPEAPFKAGRYAVLFRKGNDLPLKDDVLKFGLRKFPDNMADADKTLRLKDPSGTIIHTYTYPKAKAGRSIERGESDDAWHLSSDPRGGTPGETNSDGTPDEPDEPETPEKFSPGDVLINEVMADPKGAKGLPATEYVELHNATNRTINLKDWIFVYDKTSIKLTEAELPAGGYAVLYKEGREITVSDDAVEIGLKRFPANMVNAGKPLALKDPSGKVIHRYTYPKAKAGRSIERGKSDDAWHLSSDPRGGTPGEANSDGVPDEPDEPETPEKFSPGDVLINEVMADPKGLKEIPATEYVELHNTTDHTINLKDWVFVYDKTSIKLPEAELPAGGYAVLYKDGHEITVSDDAVEMGLKRFPANMVNAGKPLALKDPSGIVIHRYTYPKAKAGRSIERGKSDDAWHLSSDPRGGTPGETNSDGAPDEPDEPETPEKFSPGDVLINEVMADPKGLNELPATQYVELYNASGREISLKDWVFVYDKTSIKLPEAELPAGGYAVLYKDGREITVSDDAVEMGLKRFPANMINAGKPLALKDPSGKVIHRYTYPKAKAGRSIERGESDDAWHLCSDPRGGTPGEANSDGVPDEPDEPETPEKFSPGDILINEVMADPKGLKELPATEYVELHNTTDHTINLKDWVFVYDKTSIKLPEAELPAGGYAVLYKEEREITVSDDAVDIGLKRFPSNMVNAGKPLALKDPSGKVIHRYTYPKAKAGRSIERGKSDDAWHLSSDPRGGTPGDVNSDGVPNEPDEPETPDKPNVPDAPNTADDVEPREIILNEILFDPQTGGSEYIELYNRSDRTLQTAGLAIALRKNDGRLGTRHSLDPLAVTLAPGDYLLLTTDRNSVIRLFHPPAHDAIRRFQLPALNNLGATIVLLRKTDSTVVDEVTYSAKWHSSAIKVRKGVSLERIDPDGNTQDASNWTSATAEVGYGTPGYKNSQSATSKPTEGEHPSVDAPEYDAATRDYLIRYRTDKTDYRCRIEVYTTGGVKVAEIANNQLLTLDGELRWNGTDMHSRRLPPGVYIFHVELYHPDGENWHIKKPLLVH